MPIPTDFMAPPHPAQRRVRWWRGTFDPIIFSYGARAEKSAPPSRWPGAVSMPSQDRRAAAPEWPV